MFAVVQRFLFSVLAQILLIRGRGAAQRHSVFPPCSLRESSRWVPSIHQGFTDFLVGLSVDALIMETLVAGGPRDCPMRSPWAGWGRRRGVDVGLVGPSVDGLRAGRGATPWAPGARP